MLQWQIKVAREGKTCLSAKNEIVPPNISDPVATIINMINNGKVNLSVKWKVLTFVYKHSYIMFRLDVDAKICNFHKNDMRCGLGQRQQPEKNIIVIIHLITRQSCPFLRFITACGNFLCFAILHGFDHFDNDHLVAEDDSFAPIARPSQLWEDETDHESLYEAAEHSLRWGRSRWRWSPKRTTHWSWAWRLV